MTVTKEHIRQPNCSFSAQIYPCALPPKWWLCFYALQVSSPSCCYTSLLSCRIPMLKAWALVRSGRSQDYLWNGTMNGQNWLLTFVSWQSVDGSDQSQKAKGIEQLCLKVFSPHVSHTSSTSTKNTPHLLILSVIDKALWKKTCSPWYLP